jgi:hypothetical protein
MIRRSTLIAAEILLGLVAALAIGVGVAWWRLSQGPIDLAFMRPQLEAELSEARAGRPVTFEHAQLAWNANSALEIKVLGVAMEDGQGQVQSRSEEARIELAVLPLVIGRVQIVRADFSGGEITVTQRADGAVYIAFGPEGSSPDIIVPPPPEGETLQQRVGRILNGMEDAFRPVGPGGGLRDISVRDANFTLISEAAGARWMAHGARLELSRRGRALALAAFASLEGPQGAAPAELRVATDTRFSAATIEFGATGVRPRAVLSPAALGVFAGLDAPLTARVFVGLDREEGVTRFDGEATLGRGSAETPGGLFRLDGGQLHGRYDIASDELIIDQLSLAGTRTRVHGDIRVHNVSSILRATPGEPAPFDIAFRALQVDVPGTFANAISISNVRVVGAVATADRTIRIDQLHAETAGGAVDASGRVYWAAAGADQQLTPGVEMHATATGTLDAPAVINMWPIGLGEGARDYVARSLVGGRISNVVATLDVRPADIAGEALRNEAVDVRFDVTHGEMRFLQTMSPVTGAHGSGVLRGNSFSMTVTQAHLNELTLTEGRVDIPRFKPKGALATISARAEGDARRVLEVLAQEPLHLDERLPVEVESASGHASVVLRLQRPMLSEVPFEQWRFSVNGSIHDFAGQMRDRNLAISGGQLEINGDQNAIVVSGPIRAGTSDIQEVRWTERIGGAENASSSSYQISGVFDANDLQRLGYPIARYAQGRIGVVIAGEGRGFDVANARIQLNLTQAAIEAPWQFWEKNAGEASTVRFSVERTRDGGLAFNGLEARGPDMSATGRVLITADNRIADIDLTRLVVAGHSDARVRATRASDGALEVSVRGALFDAAPFMGTNEPDLPASAGGAPVDDSPVRASVVVDRLRMRGDVTLSDARVDLATHDGALVMLAVEGRSPGNRNFSLGLGPRPSDHDGGIVFRSDDAGFAIAALTGGESVVGGAISADGDWRAGPPSSARFNIAMRDFQVVRLPVMARLLSSAGSLRGLVDTLNGEGIGFDALDAQVTYANERIIFSQGRIAGPSLGLTGAGAYNFDRDDLDVDGVIAPSPRLNLSMLGSVPLIGDLLISRRGEGVFGMTYSVNGPAGSPRVGVNPVSALTPGILRRIFEPLSGRNNDSERRAEAEGGAEPARP